VDTTGNGGSQKFSREIIVFTSDPEHNQVKLTIEGKVSKFVDIPSRINLKGPAGQEIKQEITIVPRPEYPFKILEVKTQKEGNIRLDMKEEKKETGTEYKLAIVNLKTEKNTYADAVLLKTDSKIRSEIRIPVYGNIFGPLGPNPPQPVPATNPFQPPAPTTDTKKADQ
jgi:hypothetical protein